MLNISWPIILVVAVLVPTGLSMPGEGDGQLLYEDLGCGLPGVTGAPVAIGGGPLTRGSTNAVGIAAAAPDAFTVLFVSLSPGSVPFFGGTLKAFPFAIPPIPLITDTNGELFLSYTMPGGAGGLTIVVQFAVVDAVAIQGVALSNAMQLNVP